MHLKERFQIGDFVLGTHMKDPHVWVVWLLVSNHGEMNTVAIASYVGIGSADIYPDDEGSDEFAWEKITDLKEFYTAMKEELTHE